MGEVFISIAAIYLFIVVGYLAKHFFHDDMDEKTITLLSVYFLQPFLTFWGLMQRPIDTSLVYSPLLYTVVVFFVMLIVFMLAKAMFIDTKERSIFIVSSVVGNTANLGIPVGIAIFGEESIPYTTIINLANVFVVYTFGVYFYSRGDFSIKRSLLNIVRLPILWFAIMAIIFNIQEIRLPDALDRSLQMGAYASIVIQLMLFGIYLYSVRLKTINVKLLASVSLVKFIMLPTLASVLFLWVELPGMVKGILFMEMLMPLAVANVNLSSLYNCRPKDVTALVMMTSFIFIGIVFIAIEIIKRFNWF